MEPTRRLVPCEFRCFCSTCTFTFCLAKTEPVQTPWITKLTSLTTQDCCLFLSKSHSLVLNVPWLQFSQTQVSGFSTRVNVWSPRAHTQSQTWWSKGSSWAPDLESTKQLSLHYFIPETTQQPQRSFHHGVFFSVFSNFIQIFTFCFLSLFVTPCTCFFINQPLQLPIPSTQSSNMFGHSFCCQIFLQSPITPGWSLSFSGALNVF